MEKVKKKRIIIGSIIGVLIITLIVGYFAIGNYVYDTAFKREDEKSFLQDNPNLPDHQDGSGAIMDEILNKARESSKDWVAATKHEDVSITSFDGLDLVGTMFFQPVPTNNWIVEVHGYASNRVRTYGAAEAFLNEGFNILAIDLRGHGDSGGDYNTMGWLDRFDIVDWVKMLVERYPDAEIILHGTSMGGATVMMASGEKMPSNVKAVIEDCGYTSLYDIISYHMETSLGLPKFPIMPAGNSIARIRAGFDLHEASAVNQVAKTQLPMLFIHSDNDTFVPFEMVSKVYEACTTEKELYVVEGPSHAMSFSSNPDEYIRVCLNFAKRFLSD